MKVSFYNMFFPFDEEYILYNTLRGAIIEVDSEIKNLLEKNEIDSIDEDLKDIFVENEIIVEDDFDELEELNSGYEESKYEALTTTVHVVTTYDCNLACTYCHEGKGNQETKYMDEKNAQVASKFIEDLTAENFSKALGVELFGGEPLLNMPANVMVAKELSMWCEENDKVLFLMAVTNGTLLTEENVEDLAQYDCGFLVIVDGPKKIHDKRRIYKNGEGTFCDIVDGLHRAAEFDLETKIRINLDKTNKDHIVSLFEFLKEEGLTNVEISFRQVFSTSPACLANMYCIPDIHGLKTEHHLYSAAQKMNLRVEEPEEPKPLGACPAQKVSYFTVDPYMRLFKCAILPPLEKNAVGVITPENGKPEFNTVYTDFFSRDLVSLGECKECKVLPTCRGGCPAEVYEAKGTTHSTVCRKSQLFQTVEETVLNYVRTHM